MHRRPDFISLIQKCYAPKKARKNQNKDFIKATQVMVMGGLGEEHSVMKLVLGQNNWYSVPPMSFPRVQVMMMMMIMMMTMMKMMTTNK